MARAKNVEPMQVPQAEPAYDDIYHPKHYNQYVGVTCMDVSSRMPASEAQFVQYVWRYADKGDPEGDLRKALTWLYKAQQIHHANTSDTYGPEFGANGDEIMHGVQPGWHPEQDDTLKHFIDIAVNQMPALSGSAILHVYHRDYQQAVNCVYAMLAQVAPERWGLLHNPPAQAVAVASTRKNAAKKTAKKAKR